MKKTVIYFLPVVCLANFLCWSPFSLGSENDQAYEQLKQKMISKYGAIVPREWSEHVRGVKTRLATHEKVIALTLDACGSSGDGFDKKLIEYLEQEQIHATLFINGRWIDKNPREFSRLANQPLFEIENHGSSHKPCSVNGRAVYGIQGTKNAGEVVDEIELNAKKIQQLTGFKPRFYRSGNAYCDEGGVAIANDLGYEVIGFSVLGDKGTNYTKDEIVNALTNAEPGSIVILHMNHPEKETADGVIEAIPILIEKGYQFVRLAEYPLE